MHFSHTAVVGKMTEHQLHKWSSLVAAVSLNIRSTCKLGVISALVMHSSPAHTASPVNEGWTLDNETNQ